MTSKTLECMVRAENVDSNSEGTLEKLGCHGATLEAVRIYMDTNKQYNAQRTGPMIVHYLMCGQERIRKRGMEGLRVQEDETQALKFDILEVPASNYLWNTLVSTQTVEANASPLDTRAVVEYEMQELLAWVAKGELDRARRAREEGRQYYTARGAAPILGRKLVEDLATGVPPAGAKATWVLCPPEPSGKYDRIDMQNTQRNRTGFW